MAPRSAAPRALFELMRKLGVDRWCFHDRDVAPIGATFDETNANFEAMVDYAAELQAGTSIRPLWGTAQLFKEPHYAQGAATSPDPSAFLKAAAQVKRAMDATLRLGGDAFNFWGGRARGTSTCPPPTSRSSAATTPRSSRRRRGTGTPRPRK